MPDEKAPLKTDEHMIKTFLFDLGDVLLFFSHEKMCRQMGALCGRSGEEVRQLFIETKRHLAFERGEMSESEFHTWFLQESGAEVPLDKLRRAAADIFTLNSTMGAVLKELKERGHRLVLFSNTNITHIQYVREQYHVLDRFDKLVLSHEVGVLKPEDGMFESALERIECAPEECFYTDDVADYVTRGRFHGLQADVFTTTESFLQQMSERGISLSTPVFHRSSW